MFNYCQTSVLFLYKGATLVIYRAHRPYTLAGPPVRELVLDPLVAFTSTTVYICREWLYMLIDAIHAWCVSYKMVAQRGTNEQ